MSAIEWSQAVNKVITQRWRQLKDTLVMKDFAGYLIEKGVISLDYWMGLKAKPIAESERTEDFLYLVIKFDRQKYQHFLNALRSIDRTDLYRELFIPLANKTKTKGKKTGGNRDVVVQEAEPEIAIGLASAYEQSNPQKATSASKVPQNTSKDGHSDSSRETISGNTLVAATRELQKSVEKQRYKQTGTNKTEQSSEQAAYSTIPINSMRHGGIGPAEKPDTVQYPQLTTNKDYDKKTTATRIIKVKAAVCNEPCGPDVVNANTIMSLDSETRASSFRKSTSPHATLRPGTAQNRSDLMDARETQLKSRELALDRKQSELEEQKEELKTKKQELLTLETRLLAITPTTPESMAYTPKLPRSLSMSTFSSTQDSDVLSDFNERLADVKTDQEEIKVEHTAHCRNPKDDMYVQRQEFLVVQQETEQLRKSGEQKIENLRSKVENLNHEVGELQTNVDILTKEKDMSEQQLTAQLKKLQEQMTTKQASYDGRIKELETKLQAKDSECIELKSNMEDVDKANELGKRVAEKDLAEQKNENLHCKVENLNHEVGELQTNVDILTKEKDMSEQQLTAQLNKLQEEIINKQASYYGRINELETKLQAKNTECIELKSNMENVAMEFEEKVETLKDENSKQEQTMQQYKKDINLVKNELQAKVSEIHCLKQLLEKTECEKNHLIKVMDGLNSDIIILKEEKKQLEREKGTLLERFAKPLWNPNSRRSTFK